MHAIHRRAGSQLISLLARNVVDSQLTHFGPATHNSLAHNYLLTGVQSSSSRHLVLWFLFCRMFSLVLLFNVKQMILNDIYLE